MKAAQNPQLVYTLSRTGKISPSFIVTYFFRVLGMLLPVNFPAVLNGFAYVCICFFALFLLPMLRLQLKQMQLNSMIIFRFIFQLHDQR